MKIRGYTVFIVQCADGSYFSGMCRELKSRLNEINKEMKGGSYFTAHPERLPVKPVFSENNLIFKEAYFKTRYLRTLTRRYRERLIKTGRWPLGKMLRTLLKKL